MSGGFRSLRKLQPNYSTSDHRPLENFYIPVLSRAVSLDRSAGYFTSHSLSLAARGLARLIRNGGRMRLLVGEELREEDVRAIEKGAELTEITRHRLITLFQAPQDQVERKRLEALAWMVASGTLEIRVVLPRHRVGYFHVKHGIATDRDGNQISWQGSNNETRSGWVDNYEEFEVSLSWEGEWTARKVRSVKDRFQQLWTDRHPDWTTMPIPRAARRRLLRYTPDHPPTSDPMEKPDPTPQREAVIATWLKDVPHILGMEGRLGQTAVIQPWPHQSRVARQITARFPERFLLADEVGLGKTIEVGLILRELTLSRKVRRCLILTPASVRWQWQGELQEKFGMTVPVYDGRDLIISAGPGQTIRSLDGDPPWNRTPIMLMSSQLARRPGRRETLWKGPRWDLVVIDEAHHARRKDFLNQNLRRPNRLLELLEGVEEYPGGLGARTEGLLLLTATPMQVHPVEAWDLLIQLGLPGRWGADGRNFLRYFDQLRKARSDWREVNWRLVAEMARDELHHGGKIDHRIENSVKDRLGWAGLNNLMQLLDRPDRIASLRNAEQQAAMLKVLGHLTPLRRRMHRNTRQLLHTYRDEGLLPGNLAERQPQPRWVEMTPRERSLYDRVEEYISDFYKKYEDERKGLGFVMTVYRRRLTSSFRALEKSLIRRLAFLQGQASDLGITHEDWEDEDLGTDVGEQSEAHPGPSPVAAEEIGYVQDFLGELRRLGTDTKYARLEEDLQKAFLTRPNVVIFTQYTDTMDYLRARLSAVYGRRIACYSGRGGERWNGMNWERVGKEEIKQAFRDGEIKILLGTEAMAEGLNLQTCGVEINYDVPWNPMRLEQRIGRVDRIGQKFDTVKIWSYFLEDTIESEVYRRLRDRIDWFKGVVGPLQPILHRVERTIRELALQSPGARRSLLESALAKITAQIEQEEREGLDLEAFLSRPTESTSLPPPAQPAELEAFFVESQTLEQELHVHPDLSGAYRVGAPGSEQTVTFRPDLADQHPETLRFLTFGDDLFENLLGEPDLPDLSILGLRRLRTTSGGRTRVGWYRSTSVGPVPVQSLAELRQHLTTGAADPLPRERAEEVFRKQVLAEDRLRKERLRRIAKEKRSALRERGVHLLTEAAYLWSALQTSLFGDSPPSVGSETLGAMTASEPYPFAGLRRLVGGEIHLRPESPRCREIASLSKGKQQARWRTVKAQAGELLGVLASMQENTESPV